MAETKYGKYIMKEPHAAWTSLDPPPKTPSPPSIRVNAKMFETIGCDFAFVGVTQASDQAQGGHPSHTHDVDEYLFLLGGNPENILDFGAEVELTLGAGKDKEVHTITSASVVYIPWGLAHLPIVFKKLDKPVLFGHLLMAPDYSEKRDR
jgi:hypothetical protein